MSSLFYNIKITFVQVILFIYIHQLPAMRQNRCTSKNAYVTMVTDDTTAVGALVLGQSITDSKSKACRVALVTDKVSYIIRAILDEEFDEIFEAKPTPVKQSLESRFNPLFGKLNAWSLTNFSKIVYLEADTLVLKNVDELFDYSELSAVPEMTWTDLFNSGVMVIEPSLDTLKGLLKLAKKEESFDETEQGTLNMYFRDWERLSCLYNIAGDSPETATAAYYRFGHAAKIVRFQSDMKPWLVPYNLRERMTEMYAGDLGLIPVPRPFYEKWWGIFLKHVRPRLDKEFQSHNMEIVVDGHRMYIGDPYTGLHVRAGFFIHRNRSYPKTLMSRGRRVNNQFCPLMDVFTETDPRLDVHG